MKEIRVNTLAALAVDAERCRLDASGMESQWRGVFDSLRQSSSDDVFDLSNVAEDVCKAYAALQDALEKVNRYTLRVVGNLMQEGRSPQDAA